MQNLKNQFDRISSFLLYKWSVLPAKITLFIRFAVSCLK